MASVHDVLTWRQPGVRAALTVVAQGSQGLPVPGQAGVFFPLHRGWTLDRLSHQGSPLGVVPGSRGCF